MNQLITLPEVIQYDLVEMAYTMLTKRYMRKDIISALRDHVDDNGLQVTDSSLIGYYNKARKLLYTYDFANVELEKDSYLGDLMRVAKMAEADGDFANYFKLRKEIADLHGVYKQGDDGAITIEFVSAAPEEPSVSTEVSDETNDKSDT